MDFKIEKNIPKNPVKKEPKIVYPFADMEKEDSFLISKKDFGKRKETTMRQHVSNQLKSFNAINKSNFTISIKKTEDGLRVWRNT